jgi:uncharacterized protein YjbI with pentapeptide repeats
MLKARWPWQYLVLPIVTAIITGSPHVDAACVNETASNEVESGLRIHLSAGCAQAEREAHLVHGERIMDAIQKGQSVDLAGVIIQGNLTFDRLTAQTNPKPTTPELQKQGAPVGNQEQRLVRAALRIRDSVVSGALHHRSVAGTLRFEGPVDFQGTRFKDGVDLSRSIFQDMVELSGATFEKEAYFVQGQFAKQLVCRETKFGPSTRFHRSTFQGSVDCTRALFDGMAEFLEVSFEQPVTFEQSRFGLGTGFSGSRFKGRISFSEAIFSRETFFMFAAFEGEAVFADAQFLGPVDFSNAEFRQQDDLAKARFDQPPLLAQAKRREPAQPGLLQARNGQYALTLVFLVVAALLVAYAVKLK